MIVSEERQAKNKMPVYKGLEDFELVEKMGECVFGYRLPISATSDLDSCSGAFSNVYKAHDLVNKRNVAGEISADPR